MKLPRDLQHFPEPALFVVTDSQLARCWLVGGDTMEEMDGIALPHERKTDAEGFFAGSEGIRGGSPRNTDEGERRDRFAKSVAQHIMKLVRDGHVTDIYLSTLPDILHRIESNLPKEMQRRLRLRMEKDLLKLRDLPRIKKMLEAAKQLKES